MFKAFLTTTWTNSSAFQHLEVLDGFYIHFPLPFNFSSISISSSICTPETCIFESDYKIIPQYLLGNPYSYSSDQRIHIDEILICERMNEPNCKLKECTHAWWVAAFKNEGGSSFLANIASFRHPSNERGIIPAGFGNDNSQDLDRAGEDRGREAKRIGHSVQYIPQNSKIKIGHSVHMSNSNQYILANACMRQTRIISDILGADVDWTLIGTQIQTRDA